MDRDLRERERAGSDDPRELVALAAAHGRAGRRDEAARALWRARALSGDPTLALLERLQAPPSPWPTPDGEGRLGTTRAVGPRVGRVLAPSFPFRGGSARVVVDEDGTLLASLPPLGIPAPGRGDAGDARVVRLAPDTLAVSEELKVAAGRSTPDLVVSGAGTFVVAPRAVHVLRRGRALERVYETSVGDSIAGVEPASEGRWLLANAVGRIQVRRADASLAVLIDTGPTVRAFVASGESAACLTGGYSGSLEVYALGTGACRGATQVAGRTTGLGARRDGSFVVVSIEDEGNLMPPTHAATLHVFDADAKPLWQVPLGYADEGIDLSFAPDGSAYVVNEERLSLIGPDGMTRWHDGERVVSPSPLVVDGEGVAYVAGRWGLVALRPDRSVVFELAGSLVPRAIDGRGRLVCERSNGPERELVLVE